MEWLQSLRWGGVWVGFGMVSGLAVVLGRVRRKWSRAGLGWVGWGEPDEAQYLLMGCK